MSEILHVGIDRTICTGHGRCYSLVPDIFVPDDDGYGVVVAQPTPELYAAVRSAAANCPEAAVILSQAHEEAES
jgi:ferredoxin